MWCSWDWSTTYSDPRPLLEAAGGILVEAQCSALIEMIVHGGIVEAPSAEKGLTSAPVNMSAQAAVVKAGAEAGAETELQAAGNCLDGPGIPKQRYAYI